MTFGFIEILLIVGVILLIFGPRRFGLVGKSLYKGIEECKREAKKDKKE
ncbi:MAG: twin-arginine translocase TatA/TatE family subunit [Clostridiaceae bacterium]|nr:twin-arginine translocase TatA/TatE family subunit [Clostridiaceae bacterium]